MSNPKSERFRAWRNLCVAAINAGIAQGVFGTEPWDGPPDGPRGERWPVEYRFSILGRTATASVSDIGWNEVSLHIALSDKAERDKRGAADAYAHCDLERRKGAWLQTGRDGAEHMGKFRCKRLWLPTLAALDIKPQGYADHGQWFF